MGAIAAWFAEKAIFGRIAAFLKSVPWWGYAAIVGALLAWYALSVHDRAQFNKGFNAGWTQQHKALLAEQQSHAVTRASLNGALNQIDGQNGAVDALKADSDKRASAAGTALDAAQAANKPRETAAAALEASSAKTGPRDAPCVPSEAFLTYSGEL